MQSSGAGRIHRTRLVDRRSLRATRSCGERSWMKSAGTSAVRWQLQQGIMHETDTEAREAAGSCAVAGDGKAGPEPALGLFETLAVAQTDGANDGTQ
jgi:hypothetical protein